jgi:asparagine synthase (glutamine-hydrolysing)
MKRFIAFRWRPADKPVEARCRQMWAKVESRRDWALVTDRRGVLFYVAPDALPIIRLPNAYGAILGDLYTRNGTRVSAFDLDDTLALIESGGAPLAQKYWGAYAAILHDRGHDMLHVLRDPAGSSQVFWSEIAPGGYVVFSHASDFVAGGGSTDVDDAWLRAFLTRPRVISRQTGLRGANELLAGERLSFSRETCTHDMHWRPCSSREAARASGAAFATSARALRTETIATAGAWAHQRGRIIHRLSGGLDSSIVLAALSEAGAGNVECVNQFPSGQPEGDERPFARIVAAHFGARLHEIEFAPHQVQYERLADLEVGAKPSLGDLSFADTVAADAIANLAPDLITSGQGGDQLFHRSRKAWIAADAYRDGVAMEQLKRVAFDTARLARCPIWDVAFAVLRYGVMRRASEPMRAMIEPEVLAAEGASAAADAIAQAHPWRPLMLSQGPARALRLSHIAGLECYHHPNALGVRFPTAPILASQPIIELCVDVPPYVMTEGGRDRSLARAAFAELLPRPILDRKAKATTTRFHTAVLELQMSFIRAVLRGGELEARGLLRGDVLARVLSRDVVPDARMGDALVTALVAEMWLRRLKAATVSR